MRVMIAVALAFAAQAQQQPAARAEFEVVSVKPGDPAFNGSSWGTPPGRLVLRNTTLRNLVLNAYRVIRYQLAGGPKWLASAKFDVDAKLPAGAPRDQVPLMEQAMLADRFKLEVHRETRTIPEWALVVAKGGPKLRVASDKEDSDSARRWTVSNTRIEGVGVAMPVLADALTITVDAPVLDRTGLNGKYTFTLEFAPLLDTPGGDEMLPDIFAAVQEKLGLKLEAIKGPVEVLVIDRAEMPTAN
jgi:uncharacterized protein (TIGR03435 family)